MTQDNLETEPSVKPTTKAKSSGRKAKANEASLRVHLRGEAATRVKALAERASGYGCPVNESTIVEQLLDWDRGTAWLDQLGAFFSASHRNATKQP